MSDRVKHIAHFDLDAFFVSVELLKNPHLKGKPLIVGGDGQRGIVAACSYEARKFGIQSAMPSLTAKRLCPHAIFIRGSHGEYSYYSRMVTSIIAERVPLFEKASVDEFYVDLTGMDKFFENEADGRTNILNSLNHLNTINSENPNSMVIQFFFQGKSGELVKVFSKATGSEKAQARDILTRLDITNASAYNKELK